MKVYYNQVTAFETLFVGLVSMCHFLKFGTSVKKGSLPGTSPFITTEPEPMAFPSILSARLIRALALKGVSFS